jgi:hypothetical protein
MSEAVMVQSILATCHQRGVVLGIAGEKLTVDALEGAIGPDFLAELREHREDLLDMVKRGWPGTAQSQLLNGPTGTTLPNSDVVPWQECTELPYPRPKCGSLMIWWDVLGGQHCMICDKPTYSIEKAAELQELAKRLRRFANPASCVRRGR